MLLLDEPLSALDPRTRASAARELIAVLRDAGVPTLLVTHDFAEAALLGDRVGVLDDGRVVQLGTAAELSARPASAFVADFTGAVVLTGDGLGRSGRADARGARRRRRDRQHRRRDRARSARASTRGRSCSSPAARPARPRTTWPCEVRLDHRDRRPRAGRAARRAAARGRGQRGRGARAGAGAGRARDRDVEGRGDAANATLTARSRRAGGWCRRPAPANRPAPTSRSISVQPSRIPSAPRSASARMIRRYSSREPSSTIPRQSSS